MFFHSVDHEAMNIQGYVAQGWLNSAVILELFACDGRHPCYEGQD